LAQNLSPTHSFMLPGGVGAAHEARRSFLNLESGLPRSAKHTAVLLLSELVANAVRHGGVGPEETLEVCVEQRPEHVRVGVRDRAPAFKASLAREDVRLRASGLGLYFVKELSDQWGIDSHNGGKTVWFELRLS
jgi:anti-sigma regulatory factor (Ser/Thr protein kinase)